MGEERYSAGTLDLSILGYSESAISSITKTVRALNSLSNSIKKMQGVNYGAQANKLTRFFEKLATTTNAIDGKKLKTLASVGRSFSGISSIAKLEKVDYNKVAQGFSHLTIAITPFINKAREAEASLTALHGILSKSSGKKIQNLLGAGSKSPAGRNGLFNFAKMGVSLYMVRRMARYAYDIVKSGSDYLETMNLWQVAMRENLDLADKFVTKMNKAYGVSAKTTMQAQATFKNMIGSLGDLSDETAYQLSEAITQMAFDYSSLYNVQLSQAVEKFQSALAGQVRPIRSISGYDITEKTIHALYQSIGGTKTQRQLSRTEKQLLAILAVFKQMEASGATGDLGKTLNLFANQSRMMVENFEELKSWSGMLLVDLLDSWGVMVRINAMLITITEIIKAVAKSLGVGEKNFVDGIFESAEMANEEVDKLQGKLLDFDKFRSLSGQEEGAGVAIDQKLLEAISGYSSLIDQAENEAQALAQTWGEILGFTVDANGEWEISEGKLDAISNTFEAIGITVGIIVAYRLFPWLLKVATGATGAAGAMTLLNYAIIGGVVFAVLQAIDAFERGDYWAGIFATTIGVVLVGAFVLLHKKAIASAILSIVKFTSMLILSNVVSRGFALGITGLSIAFVSLAAAAVGFVLLLNNWSDMNTAQRIAAVCGIIATAVLGVAMAMGAFHSAWSMGIAAAGIAAGIAAIAVSFATIKKDAEKPIQFAAVGASNLEGGTLFVAGEMGKTEAVYTGANGKTNVANVQQMKAAFYQALVEYGRTSNTEGRPIEVYLDGERVYQNTTAHAKRRGNTWSKV